MDIHAAHGGVVPEIAARAHLDAIDIVIETALAGAEVGIEAIDGVAATGGPGLIGGVVVGTVTAKAIATARGIPYYAVNHLEGHALSPRLVAPVAFPYLLLLVSGGHTQLLAVHGPGDYERYGTTMDDAAGEAFDKSAKIMGLGYPADRARHAMERFAAAHGASALVIAGGVAANKAIFARLEAEAGDEGFDLVVPPAWLCTDNAAMIAWAALERRRTPDDLGFAPRPRWPLDPDAAPPPGRGVRA